VGQKTHPLGFRLGITQKHKSAWFSNLNQYADLLKEDDMIRTYLNTLAKSASISNIYINRNSRGDQIELSIETARPGILVGQNGAGIQKLSATLKKILPVDKQIRINIIEVENADLNAALIADYVVEQLEQRIAFRRAIRKAIQRVQNGIGKEEYRYKH
jgi:small subunit ribosomal protein S3